MKKSFIVAIIISATCLMYRTARASGIYSLTTDTLTVNSSLQASSATLTVGAFEFSSKSIAQIGAITPGSVGEAYYCNNCANTGLCISTGTTVGSFTVIQSTFAACK